MGSKRHSNRLCVFSRVVGSNPFEGHGTVLIRVSRKSKDYKLFEGQSWYKPTDIAVESETVKPEGSSSIPGWNELLSVRRLLFCGSMPD